MIKIAAYRFAMLAMTIFESDSSTSLCCARNDKARSLHFGRDWQFSIGNFSLMDFVVLVIIGGYPVIRWAGRDNRKINCKGLDYEKR